MKTFTRIIVMALAACAMLLAALTPATAMTSSGPRILVLYDAPPNTEFSKLGQAYAIMLRNLLGHFDSQVDMFPVPDDHKAADGTNEDGNRTTLAWPA